MGRFGPAIHAQKAPSELYARHARFAIAKPPIYEEEYRMSDVEGVSTFDYRIRGYNGHADHGERRRRRASTTSAFSSAGSIKTAFGSS